MAENDIMNAGEVMEPVETVKETAAAGTSSVSGDAAATFPRGEGKETVETVEETAAAEKDTSSAPVGAPERFARPTAAPKGEGSGEGTTAVAGTSSALRAPSPEGKALMAMLGATAAEGQEPDEEYDAIDVDDLDKERVKLGRQGENDTQTVVIDASKWLEALPGCTLMVVAKRPGERELYLPEVTAANGVVTWPILAQDTACAGAGRAELRAMKGDAVKKSKLFRTWIEPSLEGDVDGTPTTPPNWVKDIMGSVEAAEAAAERAEGLVDEATACAINAVRFDEAQELGEEQKTIGRGNIGAVAMNQGTANAGKALVVGGDGVVTTGDAGIPEAVKVSLLELVRHVAYIDDQGQAYYDALYAALYGGSGGYPRLQAVYAPGTHVVYTDDALDTLREYLTVKRYESAQDSGTVVTDYTLSGTLVDGLNTVLVRKDGLTAVVQVEAIDYYNQARWKLSENMLSVLPGGAFNNAADGWADGTARIGNDQWRNNYRRVVGSLKGKTPYIYVSSKESAGIYPIPIPDWANRATITITPSGQAHNTHIGRYNDGLYPDVSATGWVNSGAPFDFQPAEGQFLIVALRASSTESADDVEYTSATEPTEVTIDFEEV